MTDQTSKLLLPYILGAQAQKHLTHNAALDVLDLMYQLTLTDSAAISPPQTSTPGEIFGIAHDATDVWASHVGKLAYFDGAEWIYIQPLTGWRAYCEASSQIVVYGNGGWEALSVMEIVPKLGIYTAADDYNRLSVNSPASLFNHDGGGHQLKLNKAISGETVSFILQDNWSTRAEFGLIGGNDFLIKTSPDGSTFRDVMKVHNASGVVAMPAQSGQTFTLAQNTALALDLPGAGGMVSVTCKHDGTGEWLHGLYSYGDGNLQAMSASSDIEVLNWLAFTGQTGTQGTATIGISAGQLQFETRTPASVSYLTVTFLNTL